MQSPNRPHKIRQYLPYRKTPLFKTANASQTLQTSPCQGLRQTLTIPSAPPTAAFRAAQKNALQPLFKTLASLLKEPFFNPAREHKQDTKFKTGRKTFPNLTSFFWGRRKKFQNSNPGASSAPKPLNSGKLPLFPGIFRILSHHSNAAARKRRQKTPAPRKRGGSRICAPEKSLKNRG